MYSAGMRNSVMNVANKMPKLKLIAIGITNCACTLLSSMIGINPAAVVKEVKIIARKRFVPD